MEQLAYRPEHAARVLDVGRTVIFSLLASGELESVKVGRARLIPRRSLEAFLERRRGEGDGREATVS